MRAARTAPALALCVVFVGLVLPACDVIRFTQPCFGRKFDEQRLTLTDPDRLDGHWVLSTIDGQSIPATGYRLPPDPKKPLDPPKYLQFGVVNFSTDEAGFDNDCNLLLRSEGTAIADYGVTNIATTSLNGINRKSYAGRFHNNHETNAGYLGAGKYQAPMTITSTGGVPSIITVRVSVDIFIADVTYTLVFQR